MTAIRQLGFSLRQLRKELGYSQEQLANEAFVSVSYLRSIEHGAANPTIKIIYKIAFPLQAEVTIDISRKKAG